jgi:cyanophycin synthetase
MAKGTTDNILYFYYVMMNKWRGLVLETISPPNTEKSPSIDRPSMNMLKDGANELGIAVEELVDGAYEFKSGNVTRRIKNSASLEIAFTNWLCGNKYATFEILRKYGFHHLPYYQRYSLSTIKEAREDFLRRNKAVVIKPCSRTSGGLGVTVNIQSIKDLNRAIFISLRHDNKYLMEDFIEGDNFRILLFKDRMLDAFLRIPANVKGDGKNNIKNLLRVENDRRARDKSPVHLYPMVIDNEVRQTLLNKKISFNYVPAKDERVYVKAACNLHAGGETRDVTSIVHPDIISDCKSIMKIMNVTVGGIDIITKDINKPLAETGGVINEVNTAAGLDPHKKAAVMNMLNLMFEKNDQ